MVIYFKVLFWVAIVFGTNTVKAQTQSRLNIGDVAPRVEVAKWLKGKPQQSFENGKVYVVEFWATWCLPCIAGMPHLSEIAAKYKDEVTVLGVSVWERQKMNLSMIEHFVDSMGFKMAYNVAVDNNNYMASNWLKAADISGIPVAFIIDKNTRVAWVGLPKKMDNVLQKVISGNWDAKNFLKEYEEKKRLTIMDDNEIVTRLNPYMGNPGKPDSALIIINQILSKEPSLKYYPKMGHFTVYSLIKTDQKKALSYSKAWLAANDDPPYNTIADAVYYMTEVRKVKLLKEWYELGVYAFQAQIDNYPWSMNIPVTYDKIARYQFLAGNKDKCIEAELKAIEKAKAIKDFSADQLREFENNLKYYKESQT